MRILITGSEGFLGRHLCEHYKDTVREVVRNSRYSYDLENRKEALQLMRDKGPFDLVVNCASHNGGLKMNLDAPADVFCRNTVMGLNVLDACGKAGAGKVVSLVTSCAYPEEQWVDDKEGIDNGIFFVRKTIESKTELFFLHGQPHDSVSCHGYAKRNLQLASMFYRKQYGLKAVCVCPTTLYGPGDNFDPETSKVVAALVKKFVDAADNKADEVSLWGDGTPLREIMYVKDAVKLIARAAEVYDDSNEPLNLGTGQEFSVRNLAELVAKLAGFRGSIRWDTALPNGTMRKLLSLEKMRKVLGEFTPTSAEEGLIRTIEWYREMRCS